MRSNSYLYSYCVLEEEKLSGEQSLLLEIIYSVVFYEVVL